MWSNAAFKGSLAVIFASVIWGTTGTAASFVPDVSPLAIGAFAMSFGGLLLVLHARKNLRKEIKSIFCQPKGLLIGGLSVALYPLAFYSSMRLSGVAIGTLISIASAPFFTVVLERLISKRNITLKWGLSFVFGALGVCLLVMGKADSIDVSQNQDLQNLGVLLGLIAGLSYATYSWSARQMIETGISSSAAMASLFGVAALLLLPVVISTGQNLFTDVTHTTTALYMAVVPMFVGYLCFGYGLRSIPASNATLITLLEPVVATVFAVHLVGEQFMAIGWFGMVLVAICLLLQIFKFPVVKDRTLTPHHHHGGNGD